MPRIIDGKPRKIDWKSDWRKSELKWEDKVRWEEESSAQW